MNRWRLCFRRERPEEKKGSKIGGSVPLVLQGTPYCTTYRSLNHDPTTYARWSKCESFLYVGKTRVHMLCEFVRRKCFVQRIKSPHIDSDANDPLQYAQFHPSHTVSLLELSKLYQLTLKYIWPSRDTKFCTIPRTYYKYYQDPRGCRFLSWVGKPCLGSLSQGQDRGVVWVSLKCLGD